MASANDWLAGEAVARSIDTTKFSNWLAYRLLAILNRADANLAAELQVALETLEAGSFSVQRLESLLASVRALNAQVYAELTGQLTEQLEGLVQAEVEFQEATLRQPLPRFLVERFNAVSLDEVRAAALARPFQGRLLSEWAQSIEKDRMTRIRDTVRMGVVEGKTTAQIVRTVRGTRAQQYQDGIIQVDRRHAETVIRTAVSHTAGYARDQVLEANADLVKGVTWRSTLDSRTSQPCRIRDGLQYALGSHRPIGHSHPWGPGPGRFHWGCRSTSAPVLKSWQELGGEALLDWTPDERASMDGAVPADTTYAQWLKRQSAARQDDILGKTRGALFRRGGLPLDAFSNNRGQMLTLEQLRARQPQAFKTAGV